MARIKSPRQTHGSTVAAWAEATGTQIDESVVVEALEELRAQGWLTLAPPPLTDAETLFLTAHGGVRDNRDALLRSRVISGFRTESHTSENLTVDQTAELLNVSASRVRHRVGDGSIYAYPSVGRGVARRIPAWQFDDHKSIPHLAAVLAELPDGYRPSEIRDFALNAHIDDPIRDATVPLLQWLRDGGDPALARELAAAQRDVI